jgi:hypothetical protein
LPPCVSTKVTLTDPGAVARSANEKAGFSLTLCVRSKVQRVFANPCGKPRDPA